MTILSGYKMATNDGTGTGTETPPAAGNRASRRAATGSAPVVDLSTTETPKKERKTPERRTSEVRYEDPVEGFMSRSFGNGLEEFLGTNPERGATHESGEWKYLRSSKKNVIQAYHASFDAEAIKASRLYFRGSAARETGFEISHEYRQVTELEDPEDPTSDIKSTKNFVLIPVKEDGSLIQKEFVSTIGQE